MRFLHWLNIVMIGIGVVLLATSLVKFYPNLRQVNHVKSNMITERNTMKRAVEHCEAIAKVEGEFSSFEKATPDYPDFDLSWYPVLKEEVGKFSSQFAKMTSHINCSYGMPFFEKDAVSDEVHFGYECHAPITCHAHTVSINGHHFMYSGNRGYAVPKADTLRIAYTMYSLSYEWDKIDRVVVQREIKLN